MHGIVWCTLSILCTKAMLLMHYEEKCILTFLLRNWQILFKFLTEVCAGSSHVNLICSYDLSSHEALILLHQIFENALHTHFDSLPISISCRCTGTFWIAVFFNNYKFALKYSYMWYMFTWNTKENSLYFCVYW